MANSMVGIAAAILLVHNKAQPKCWTIEALRRNNRGRPLQPVQLKKQTDKSKSSMMSWPSARQRSFPSDKN
jgi:hypothetical protein